MSLVTATLNLDLSHNNDIPDISHLTPKPSKVELQPIQFDAVYSGCDMLPLSNHTEEFCRLYLTHSFSNVFNSVWMPAVFLVDKSRIDQFLPFINKIEGERKEGRQIELIVTAIREFKGGQLTAWLTQVKRK